MDEISKEVGVELQTDSLLTRAEQLTRFESDKLIDKVRLLIIGPYQFSLKLQGTKTSIATTGTATDLLHWA